MNWRLRGNYGPLAVKSVRLKWEKIPIVLNPAYLLLQGFLTIKLLRADLDKKCRAFRRLDSSDIVHLANNIHVNVYTRKISFEDAISPEQALNKGPLKQYKHIISKVPPPRLHGFRDLKNESWRLYYQTNIGRLIAVRRWDLQIKKSGLANNDRFNQ